MFHFLIYFSFSQLILQFLQFFLYYCFRLPHPTQSLSIIYQVPRNHSPSQPPFPFPFPLRTSSPDPITSFESQSRYQMPRCGPSLPRIPVVPLAILPPFVSHIASTAAPPVPVAPRHVLLATTRLLRNHGGGTVTYYRHLGPPFVQRYRHLSGPP